MTRRFSELAATSPKMNGGKMADRLKFALLSLLVALVTFVAAPIAKADAWDKETIVTFSSPVEVPGQVLPPGTYVFKRGHSEWDRDIVQIFTKDQRNLLATAGLNQSMRLILQKITVQYTYNEFGIAGFLGILGIVRSTQIQ